MFKEIRKRWKAESPDFFVKVKSVAITVGSSAIAVWLANSSLNLALDEVVLGFCKYTIAFCAAAGLTSKLTVKNPPQN